MKTVKFIHFADLHYCAEHKDDALTALEELTAFCRHEKPDAILMAGDLFDRGVQNSSRGALPDLVDAFHELLALAPIYGVSGTPTHDLPGCYQVLEALRVGYNRLTMLPSHHVGLPRGPDGEAGLFLSGIPEIERGWFLSGREAMGAEDAAERIVKGARAMLAGIGAERRNYPTLPSVLIYHGQIAGARISEGHALRPGGVQIGAEDLQLACADYYALGDIHLSQQIGELPAYYSGSCFPVDWGELDQKSFNFVEFFETTPGAWKMEMTLIPFSFAPRMKIVARVGDVIEADVVGRQVWVQTEGARAELAGFDAAMMERALSELIKRGAVKGSRMTTRLLPDETVRAPEIADVPTLARKLKIYAEATDITIGAGVTKLAEHLEDEVLKTDTNTGSPRIRMRRLKLRGAIGIWRGQHVDDIDLDLDAYEPGLIALVGSNGEGKTTLLENLHPYPHMLTRRGTLQSHFRLRDSWRELTFIDERFGHEYRALLQIDGATKSGAVVYHLYRDGTPMCNGRREDYEQAIEKLFGPVALFLRTAFAAERPTKNSPDLSAATPGEKKMLFRELDPRIGYLQVCSDIAHEHAKTEGLKCRDAETRADALAIRVTADAGLDRSRAELTERHAAIDAQLVALACSRDELRQKAARAHDRKIVQDGITARLTELAGEDAKLGALGMRITNTEIPDLTKVLAEEAPARAKTIRFEELRETRRELEAEYRAYLEREAMRDRARVERERKIYTETQRLDLAVTDEKNVLRQIETATAVESEKLAPLKIEAAKRIDETCPTCGQTLPEEQRKRLKTAWLLTRDKATAVRARISELVVERGYNAVALTAAMENRGNFTAPPEIVGEPAYDKTALDRVVAELDGISIMGARNILIEAATAQTKIDEARKRVTDIEAQRSALQAKTRELSVKSDPLCAETDRQATAAYDSAQREVDAVTAEVTSLAAEIKALDGQIVRAENEKHELDDLQKQVMEIDRLAGDWDELSGICGPNGIQALELDALAPSISEVANRLLEAAYGSQFSVKILTTRMGGTGSSQHQIEDFRIVVTAEDGEDQDLDTVCGGEGVWIKKALSDAFGIVRARNSGTEFLTRSLDEADGKLNADRRMEYFRLLEAAHAESGCHQTIVVTHSPEIQDAIQQHVSVSELAEAARPAH